jgi:putative iron-dependent peroxidase
LQHAQGEVMSNVQPGILAPVPGVARYMFFALEPGSDPSQPLRCLRGLADGDQIVVGLGQSLVLVLGCKIQGLRVFPHDPASGFDVPSTPAALWLWLRGDDRGQLVHLSRLVERTASPAFHLTQVIDAFRHGTGLDLTGYEDGTENPKGEAAIEASSVRGREPGLDGPSFVAVQQWIHDFDKFESMTAGEQDNSIGRRKSDNKELEEAPPAAHVKRTAQESFDPAAFVLRRSMPWADQQRAGLVFVSFGKSFDAFEAQLKRMEGIEDGISDALFKFTRPVSGSYFWCPPLKNERLDLSARSL